MNIYSTSFAWLLRYLIFFYVSAYFYFFIFWRGTLKTSKFFDKDVWFWYQLKKGGHILSCRVVRQEYRLCYVPSRGIFCVICFEMRRTHFKRSHTVNPSRSSDVLDGCSLTSYNYLKAIISTRMEAWRDTFNEFLIMSHYKNLAYVFSWLEPRPCKDIVFKVVMLDQLPSCIFKTGVSIQCSTPGKVSVSDAVFFKAVNL